MNDSTFSEKIKSQAVIEVLQEKEPIEAIAGRYRVEVVTLLYWKQQVLDAAEGFFSNSKHRQSSTEKEIEALRREKARLEMERDFLLKVHRKAGLENF